MSELETVLQRLEKQNQRLEKLEAQNQRIEVQNHRLEKHNRRLKLTGIAGLLACAGVVLMGQDPVASARFDTVTARAFVVDDGGGQKAFFNSQDLTYWEGEQPVVRLGKNHLNLGAIDLSVTEAGDAFISVGQAPNQRIELRSSSLGTDIKIGGQTEQGSPPAASTPVVGTPVEVTYQTVKAREIVLLDETGGSIGSLSGRNGLRLWQGGNPSSPQVELGCQQGVGKLDLRGSRYSVGLRAGETGIIWTGIETTPIASLSGDNSGGSLLLGGESEIEMGRSRDNPIRMRAGQQPGTPSIVLTRGGNELLRIPSP